jgi:hypothetical protein
MYTQEQINMVLSILANAGGSLMGSANDIEKQMLAIVEGGLKLSESMIGKWSVAWGPAVYQAPSSKVADSTMYVAKQEATSESPAKLVLAIAGTNGLSIFGWVVLDLWVSQQAPWNLFKPDQGKLSMGSYTGFNILRSMKPGPDAISPGKTIKEFMTEEATNPVAVTVTGHSLGGALAPPLALWLYEEQKEWDPAGTATLDVMPSAGPTSGNGDWASYYDSCLGDKTNRIWNSKDIVPHAWSMLDGLAEIYAPEIPADSWIETFINAAKYLARNGDYTQINTSNEFQGTVQKAIIISKLPDFANYLTQALYQHTFGYVKLLGIQESEPVKAALDTFSQAPDELKEILEHERPALELARKREG